MGFFDIFSGRSPDAHMHRGDEYVQAGAFGDALIEYEKALDKIEKRFPEKSHLKERLVEKMRSAGNHLAVSHLENAEAMARAGDLADARELCQLAMELADDDKIKNDIETRLSSFDTGEQVADNDFAYDTFQDDADEEDAYVEELFGVLCNALPEDLREAYHGYGRSFMYGYVALNEGDFQAAAEELEAAMDENQQHSLVPLELATAYIHLERDEAAAELLESFVRQNPEQPRAYQLLCEIYWEQKAHDRVTALLSNTPDSIKKSKALLMLDGENLFQQKKYAAAESAFENYTALYGKDEIVLRALARTLEASGKVDVAKTLYAEILNTCLSCGNRADPFLKRRYAELCYQTGDTSSTLVDIYLGLVQEDPDNRGTYFKRVADILLKMGEADEAKRYETLARNAPQ